MSGECDYCSEHAMDCECFIHGGMENMDQKPNFLRNHADTVAILGVNIAIAAILVTMCLSNMSNVNAVNARIDTLHVMFYDLLKEVKKQ